MSRTESYSRFHRALLTACREFNVEPMVGRIAVALYERGGSARTDQLERDLFDRDGAAIRRALARMYRLNLALGVAIDGRPRRNGVRSQVALTQSGRSLAGRILVLSETRRAVAA